jgi:hypothetical protein
MVRPSGVASLAMVSLIRYQNKIALIKICEVRFFMSLRGIQDEILWIFLPPPTLRRWSDD